MVTPERTQYVKELFQDLATKAVDYYELKSYVEGMWESGEFSDEEYDLVMEHWEEWLDEAEDEEDED